MRLQVIFIRIKNQLRQFEVHWDPSLGYRPTLKIIQRIAPQIDLITAHTLSAAFRDPFTHPDVLVELPPPPKTHSVQPLSPDWKRGFWLRNTASPPLEEAVKWRPGLSVGSIIPSACRFHTDEVLWCGLKCRSERPCECCEGGGVRGFIISHGFQRVVFD